VTIRRWIGLPVINTRLIKIEREFVGNTDLYVKENLFRPSELGRRCLVRRAVSVLGIISLGSVRESGL
jgi:hypothetical protein